MWRDFLRMKLLTKKVDSQLSSHGCFRKSGHLNDSRAKFIFFVSNVTNIYRKSGGGRHRWLPSGKTLRQNDTRETLVGTEMAKVATSKSTRHLESHDALPQWRSAVTVTEVVHTQHSHTMCKKGDVVRQESRIAMHAGQ